MPTYEYECTKCNHRFERFQSMKDEHVKRCPECRCKVQRLIGTGAGIIFKGSGFYQTDYRSKDYHEAAKKDTSAASAPAASDAKSAATTEGKKEATAAKKSTA
ncbi:MAG TPA: FmdB family transcriptional regulator [Verrucomicrobia bacterium]|nr:FmdB family transcriptional regulator [Verrucomicrobiota bacterium]